MRTRRHFLRQATMGFGSLALADLLWRDRVFGNEATSGPAFLAHPPKVKRIVQLFMAGAASHVDTFDHKPALQARDGQPWDVDKRVELFQSQPGAFMGSPWKFQPYGNCGKQLSEIVSPLGDVVDDLAFVHNVVGKTGVHSQGTLLQTTGFNFPGFPSAGAWVSYALGSENENLPTFVVLPDHRGLASNGAKNWGNAFLSAEYQGTVIRPGQETPINDLFPPKREYITPQSERLGRDALQKLNSLYAEQRPEDDRLTARVKAYQLAGAMQLSATNALDLSDEPQYIRDMYGLVAEGSTPDDSTINTTAETEFFGRKCLVARRLLERGVRFVQIWSGNDNGHPRRNWDSHENVQRDHEPLARGMASGAAALIKDLQQRDMLKDTLIIWTTEFGRMPCSQGSKGRDHNPFVFTNWLCGGGIRPGTFGNSDEL
ncbi:MAG: DUF1501 domain-containing protein, partial [Planctomycetota bacterium]